MMWVMLDIPSEDMHCCVILLCEVCGYCLLCLFLLSMIKFKATQLSILDYLTKNFGRHNSGFVRHNFG